MNNELNILGYTKGDSFVYQINAAAKMLFFFLIAISIMLSYDTRFLLFIALFSTIVFYFSNIPFVKVKLVLKILISFAVLNLIFIYLFDNKFGERLYNFANIKAELFYLFNIFLKYICTVPLALIFILTTDTSKFAASLNKLKIPYKIAYAVSLTLRYIPNIQEEFFNIRNARAARGFQNGNSNNLLAKFQNNLSIITPLFFISLNKIDTISTAMELRRFGKEEYRTWFDEEKWSFLDYAIIAFAICCLLIVLILFKINNGRFYNPFL